MPAELDLSLSARVIEHPDTPAAYVEWQEILPLIGNRDRDHVNSQLAWSPSGEKEPLGCSRRLFSKILQDPDSSTLQRWMSSLAQTPIRDFMDFHIPWLRNVHMLDMPHATEEWLNLYQKSPSTESRGSMPDSVIIEITRSCNFACTMCSSRTGGYRPEYTMPLEEFGEIVRVLSPSARSLRINGYGESTLVPDFSNYISCLDFFSYHGLREVITNLSAPIDRYYELFDKGFIVIVSWDAADPELFGRVRVGSDYPRMLETLTALGAHASAAKERLVLLCTIQESNLSQIEAVARLAASVGAGLLIYNMVKEEKGSPWMNQRIEELVQAFGRAAAVCNENGVGVRIPDHAAQKPISLSQANRSSGTRCNRPWREIMVGWDTELTVCNMFNPYSYGILRPSGQSCETQERFQRLWSGPNAQFFRGVINSERPHPYCQECYFLYPEKSS